MSKKITTSKGITLIALIITIMVLIILAGVTLNMVLGDDGVIKQAQEEKLAQQEDTDKETIRFAVAEQDLKIKMNGGTRNATDLTIELEEIYGTGNVLVEPVTGFENEFKVTIDGDENRIYRAYETGRVSKWE